MILMDLLMFGSVQGVSGHINKPRTTVFSQLNVKSSASMQTWEGDLQEMALDETILEDHFFDQFPVIAVPSDDNNNHIIFSYAVVNI